MTLLQNKQKWFPKAVSVVAKYR